jgi:hypothetical protein
VSAPTLDQLQRDIAELESQALIIQNRILRKRIAIEEIVAVVVCRAEGEPMVQPPVLAPSQGCTVLAPGPTVPQMVQSVLPPDGAPITFRELRQRSCDRYPEHQAKIKVGFWQTVKRLIAKGAPIVELPRRQPQAAGGLPGTPAGNGGAPVAEPLSLSRSSA